MQQVQNLNQNQSQAVQQNKPYFEIIERTTSNYLDAIAQEANIIQAEESEISGIRWSLLKYVINNPENIGIISNRDWLDKDERDLFDKLKLYIQSLKTSKESYKVIEFYTYAFVTDGERSLYDFYLKQAEVPDSLFNAQQLCERLQESYNRKQRFFNSFQILLAKDNETASLYARQLVTISESAPIHAKIFGTDTKLPKTKYTLKKDGVPILEDQNFYVVMGKEKSGKSHILSVFLASYSFGSLKSFGLESMIDPNSKILYIDTEQSSSDAHNICQTANILAGKRYDEPNERLIIASCDEVPANQMLTEIRNLIEAHKPKVVFLDGYAGLLEDVYKNTGVDPIMKEVRSITRQYNLIIIGVFHTKTDNSNPLSGKEDSVTAFGAFGKLFQKYGGGTFLVENNEGLISMKHHQARKSKCPDIYCKLDGRIYIDDPEGKDPEICKVVDGNTDEVLNPRHKDINDDDVHSFAIPVSLSEGEYNEVADKSEIEREKKEEIRKVQKAETRLKTKVSEYEEMFSAIFHSNDEHLTDNDLLERWREWYKIKEGYLSNDTFKDTDNIRKKRSRHFQEARKLGILYNLPSGLNAFKIVSTQQVTSE